MKNILLIISLLFFGIHSYGDSEYIKIKYTTNKTIVLNANKMWFVNDKNQIETE